MWCVSDPASVANRRAQGSVPAIEATQNDRMNILYCDLASYDWLYMSEYCEVNVL